MDYIYDSVSLTLIVMPQEGGGDANLKNFSIRSTCVMIILLQQYRLQPSLSIASLFSGQQGTLHVVYGRHTHQESLPREA